MKRLIAGAVLAVGLAACSQSNSPPPQAAAAAAQPQATRQVCTKERVVSKNDWGTGGTAGTVIGGAAGGLLGNQFGHGGGKTAMTAAGAVGGAVAGHEIGKDQDTQVSVVEHCHDQPVN